MSRVITALFLLSLCSLSVVGSFPNIKDMCEHPHRKYFQLMPVQVGSVKLGETPIIFKNTCFQKAVFVLEQTGQNSVVVNVKLDDASSYWCSEYLLYSTGSSYQFRHYYFTGSHTVELDNLQDAEMIRILDKGVQIYAFCNDISDSSDKPTLLRDMIFSSLKGVELYPSTRSQLDPAVLSHNLQFLKDTMNLEHKQRENLIGIQKEQVKSGDMIGTVRLDGLDALTMYLTGSRISHVAMALWKNVDGVEKLYIVESQNGVQWPTQGIQMNLWEDWLTYIQDVNYNAVLLPLTQQERYKFDREAAWRYFQQVKGSPYGFQSLIFTWFDTEKDNLPPFIPSSFIDLALRVLENTNSKAFQYLIGQALNSRLGTKNLNLDQIYLKSLFNGLSIAQLAAIPQQDDQDFQQGQSFIGSTFVAKLYQVSGVLRENFNAQEMTPRDLYSLTIFESQKDLLPCSDDVCMISGYFKIDLGPEYGTVLPHPHMADTCPSIAPEYVRPVGCQQDYYQHYFINAFSASWEGLRRNLGLDGVVLVGLSKLVFKFYWLGK